MADLPETPTETPSIQTSLVGSLLIAMPMLVDPNFHRSVVLMVAHDENGAFGVVLGKKMKLTLNEVGEPFGLLWRREIMEFVRYGGPCERSRIWLMHGGEQALAESATIAPGIHLGSSPDLLRNLHQRPDVPMMVFSGYAGWAPGQLEREVQEKAWLPGELTPELIFSTSPDEVWEKALRISSFSPDFINSGHGASA